MSKITTETFNFFVPIAKSGETSDGRRWISGIASTEDRDLQNEIVVQKGIDYSYFLKYGYINDDHARGIENKVGEPVECRLTPKGLWIKGFLYKGKARADHWWNHLQSLEQSDSNRKAGFSIEGKVQRREGNKIVKCWLQNVAITEQPVNTASWAEISKSLNKQEWDDTPWDNDEDNETEEKALTTSSGASLIPQSLERNKVVTTFKSLDSLDFDQAVMYCQLVEGYSHNTAVAIVKSIFAGKGY